MLLFQDKLMGVGLVFMKVFLIVATLLIIVGAALNFFPAHNQSLFLAFNSLLPVSSLWIAITTLGDGAVAGCLFYLIFFKRSEFLVKGLIGAVAALIVTQGLKHLFGIPRPEYAENFSEKFHLLTESMAATSFSMPSGHSMTGFLLGAMMIGLLKPNLLVKVLIVAMMIAIALSRIALGVHWPADILVGAGLGLIIAIFSLNLSINMSGKWGVRAVHIFYWLVFVALIHKYFL